MSELEAAKRKIVNRAVNPFLFDLPDWVERFRPQQVEAINQIVEAFSLGVNMVVLDAPTGSGKTLIGETVRLMLQARANYVCHSIGLQDQFARDFPYAKVLKGRGNYPTGRFPEAWPEVSAAECTAGPGKPECKWCGVKAAGNCPYERAKHEALSSSLAVLNTTYFLTEANGPGRLADRTLVIMDEADTIESELMSWVSVEISPRRAKQLGLSPPKKVTVADSWKEWIDDAAPRIVRALTRINPRSEEPRDLKERAFLSSLGERLSAIRTGLESEDSPWVYTGKEDRIAFKPARVDKLGPNSLWAHGQRWLLMSATVISADEMLGSLGWEGSHQLVRIGSVFDKEKRQVIVQPTANLARTSPDTEKAKMASAVRGIVARHPNDRVLVHTVSYDRAAMLAESLAGDGRPIFTYRGREGRDQALADYLREEGAVLVAPSMDRGVDLPGDACRVQIIVKAPFPNLGDRQISARLHSRGGNTWYLVQTARTIVQMCGRAVRNDEDYAVTYILDTQFVSNVWNRGRHLFPEWWKEALVWERP